VSEKDELYRRFTPVEAAAIQSFPESFKFAGSEGDPTVKLEMQFHL